MSEECRCKIIRRDYFSGLEKSGKESIDIGMKNLGEVQFCNNLFLGEFILITDGLDILTDIHIWSDFLHHKVLS